MSAVKPPRAPGAPDLSGEHTFSFKYWGQLKYFGLSEGTPDLFSGIYEGLGRVGPELGQLRHGKHVNSEPYNYHKVDLTQAKVPLKRDDFDWLPDAIRKNKAEFDFFQFSIFHEPIRIVGFFDARKPIFHVVLVDLHHNIQTARNFPDATYCYPVLSRGEELIRVVNDVKEWTDRSQCSCKIAIQKIIEEDATYTKGFVFIPRDTLDMGIQKAAAKGKTHKDIYEDGVLV